MKAHGRATWVLFLVFFFAVVALLFRVPFSGPRSSLEVGQDAKVRADIFALSQSLDGYKDLNGRFPTTEQGLDALVTKPATGPTPDHWYRMEQQLPKDPYGSDYVYAYPGRHNPHGYDLSTKGKDRVANTADDIGNWEL